MRVTLRPSIVKIATYHSFARLRSGVNFDPRLETIDRTIGLIDVEQHLRNVIIRLSLVTNSFFLVIFSNFFKVFVISSKRKDNKTMNNNKSK